jgi:homogentisate 1,2-dioxygenase
MRFERGDYIVVPRAVTYRIVPDTADNFFLIVNPKANSTSRTRACWASTRCTIRR